MVTPPRVSLSEELREIEHALDGAQILLDSIVRQRFDDERENLRAVTSASAVVGAMNSRLGLVRQVLRGVRDPADVAARHNDAGLVGPDETDTQLAAWTPRRRIEHAQAELTRAKRAEKSRT